MKLSKIIFVAVSITIFFSSCSNKEYHAHSQITLIEENSEIIITEQTYKSENESDAEFSHENVYYTKSGKCYHYINPCGRGTYYECTLEEAENKGLLPCEKCVK